MRHRVWSDVGFPPSSASNLPLFAPADAPVPADNVPRPSIPAAPAPAFRPLQAV